MGQLSFLLAAVVLVGLVTIVVGVFTYFVIRLLKTIDNRILLALKVMSHNLKTLKSYGGRLNSIKSDSQKIISYQSKAFDYQNVLINSLNRQLRNLDAILSDSKQLAHSGNKSTFLESSPSSRNPALGGSRQIKPHTKIQQGIPSRLEETANRNSSVKNSVTLLNQLLVEKRTLSVKNRNEDDKIAKLSTIFRQADPGDIDNLGSTARRVSNG